MILFDFYSIQELNVLALILCDLKHAQLSCFLLHLSNPSGWGKVTLV